MDGLVEYRSSKNKYRLQRPAGWEETSKAGADVLFQDPAQKSTNIGITVSPIRINSLDQFGDVTSVGEKLLATERSKVIPFLVCGGEEVLHAHAPADTNPLSCALHHQSHVYGLAMP